MITTDNTINFKKLLNITENDLSVDVLNLIAERKFEHLAFDFKLNKIVLKTKCTLFYRYNLTNGKDLFNTNKTGLTMKFIVNRCNKEYKKILENLLTDSDNLSDITDIQILLPEEKFIKTFKDKYLYSDQLVELYSYIYDNRSFFVDKEYIFAKSYKHKIVLNYCMYNKFDDLLGKVKNDLNFSDSVTDINILNKIFTFTKEEQTVIASILEEKFNTITELEKEAYAKYIKLMKQFKNDNNYGKNNNKIKNRFYLSRLFFIVNENNNNNYLLDISCMLEQKHILDSNEECVDYYEGDFMSDLQEFINIFQFPDVKIALLFNETNDFSQLLNEFNDMKDWWSDDTSKTQDTISAQNKTFNQFLSYFKKLPDISSEITKENLIIYDSKQTEKLRYYNPYYYNV